MNLAAASDGNLCVTGLDRLSASNCAAFKELVKPRLTDHCRRLELDCSTIQFIDSDGFGTLVNLNRRLAMHDGKLRLKQPSPMLRQSLHLLHLDEIFELTP